MEKAEPIYPDAIYRCFEGNDAECWARCLDGKIDVLETNIYQFTGILTGPSKFFLKKEECLDRILAEGAGIIINRKQLPLCNPDFKYNKKTFLKKDSRFSYNELDQQSADGKTYKLFQDYDMGARGWAIFTVKSGSRVKVINEDHNDNIRDWTLTEKFLEEMNFNVNLKYLERLNHDFYKGAYEPTKEDFQKDFHINDEGKIKKA
jgi:hypothetical protein